MDRRNGVERVYVPYWDWEDFQNGMWRKLPKDQEQEMLQRAIEFTGNHLLYGEAMGRAIREWKNTMLNSLTNIGMNRRAFLGHCACSLEFNCPEYITRAAWKHLTEEQRRKADKEAQTRIDQYINERKNRKICEGLGKQVLLWGDS